MKTKPTHLERHYDLKLYADGGVIQKNPSPIGGTWAWCLVQNDEVINKDWGIIVPTDVVTFPDNQVTNNQTELFAIVQGLSQLPDDSVVEICSDSNVSLGRVFRGSSFSNIPFWLKTSLEMQQSRLKMWKDFSYTLLDGHPTKAHLASGFGKRGHPVSKWNVECDRLCNLASSNHLEWVAV